MLYRSIAFLLSVVMLCSCATLLADDERSVMITSNPPGAQITVNGVARGFTPAKILVNDHERLEVAIHKNGYHPAGCYINTSIGAIWVVADLVLFYTIVPLVIDLITGEWHSLDSGYCTVNLAPLR